MSLLTSAYSIANRTGVFKIPGAYRAFAEAYFAYKARLEDPFAALVRRYPALFSAGHIVDVGANIGYTAGVFLDAVDAPFLVFALEPEPRNFATAQMMLKRHRNVERLVLLNVAVGERDGTLDLWLNRDHHADHRIATAEFVAKLDQKVEFQKVAVVSVDSLLASRDATTPVAFIKIDVQGFELQVCLGMEETLRKNPDVAVAIEYCPEAMRDLGFEAAALTDFFESRSLPMLAIARDGSLREMDDPTVAEEIGRRGYVDVLCSRRCATLRRA